MYVGRRRRDPVASDGEKARRFVHFEITASVPVAWKCSFDENVESGSGRAHFGVRFEDLDDRFGPRVKRVGVWVTTVIEVDADELIVVGEDEPDPGQFAVESGITGVLE